MSMRAYKLLLVAGSLALGACAHLPQKNMPPEELPKNSVEVTNASHVVQFTGPAGTLSEAEKAALDAFIYNQKVAYGDELVLDFNPADVNWQAKMAAINAHLKTRGLWVWNASATGTVADAATASFEVNHYTAVVPDCRTMSRETYPKGQTWRWPAFGCTTVQNLGVMAAAPQDLVQGKPDAGPHSLFATRAIQLYRSRFAIMGWAVEPATSLVKLQSQPRREDDRPFEDKGGGR
jgi:type IV pilus biogenesis protein CpaD/CtpE